MFPFTRSVPACDSAFDCYPGHLLNDVCTLPYSHFHSDVLVEGQCKLNNTGCAQESDGTVQVEMGIRFNATIVTYELSCYNNGTRAILGERWVHSTCEPQALSICLARMS